MWSLLTLLTDNLPAVIAAVTALAGAWLKWRPRPRRIIGWATAAKEVEMYRAMLANEHEWATYWRQQAEECRQRLTGDGP